MSALLDKLIDAFEAMPSIGRRTAQRISLQLLSRNRVAMRALAAALQQAAEQIRLCEQCRNFSETEICPLCSSESRDRTLLCIVETPADQYAIEEHGNYRGRYFVLHGYLSPLDGLGPKELGLNLLPARCQGVEEIILATNTTVEGEATAYAIAEQVRSLPLHMTRIASGIPLGGEIEYVDGSTLSAALQGRRRYEH